MLRFIILRMHLRNTGLPTVNNILVHWDLDYILHLLDTLKELATSSDSTIWNVDV